jgi:hypothetical protein
VPLAAARGTRSRARSPRPPATRAGHCTGGRRRLPAGPRGGSGTREPHPQHIMGVAAVTNPIRPGAALRPRVGRVSVAPFGYGSLTMRQPKEAPPGVETTPVGLCVSLQQAAERLGKDPRTLIRVINALPVRPHPGPGVVIYRTQRCTDASGASRALVVVDGLLMSATMLAHVTTAATGPKAPSAPDPLHPMPTTRTRAMDYLAGERVRLGMRRCLARRHTATLEVCAECAFVASIYAICISVQQFHVQRINDGGAG